MKITLPKPLIHFITGVIVIYAIFSFVGHNSGKLSKEEGVHYITYYAVFSDIGTIKAGDYVYVNGYPTGLVQDINIDSNYSAKVTMSVDSRVSIPIDSMIKVKISGYTDNYLDIVRGESQNYFEDKDVIYFTTISADVYGVLDGIAAYLDAKNNNELAGGLDTKIIRLFQ